MFLILVLAVTSATKWGLIFITMLAEYDKTYIDLALGVLTHGTCLPGLDTYADESYHGEDMGFCFQEGRKIADKAQRICNLPSSMALWKSHNIIELAFDAMTAQRSPGVGRCGEEALEKVDDSLCAFLGRYLGVKKETLRKCFVRYQNSLALMVAIIA